MTPGRASSRARERITFAIVRELARDLLEGAWRRVAPKKLVADYDGRPNRSSTPST